MAKKILITLGLTLFLVLIIRSIYCYRIIAISNLGDLKYKDGSIVYFPEPPFSVINPFKKTQILNSIRDYCISKEFEKYHELRNYKSIKYRDFFAYKNFALENLLMIKSIKDYGNTILILVANKNDLDLELVIRIDKNTNEIIGYF